MKVVRLHAHGELCLRDEPEPVPVAGEALVRVRRQVFVVRTTMVRRGGNGIVFSLRNQFEAKTSNHGR